MADLKFHTLTIADKYADMFPIGTVLHRALNHDGKKLNPADVEFQKTDKGTVMARMQFLNGAGWEPHVFGATENGQPTTGMVVFLDVPPDDDWTHLIVTGCSKKMREAVGPDGGKNDRGMCLFAKAAKPYDMADYLKFREKLDKARDNATHYGIEQAIKASLDIWPSEQRTGERRVVVERNWIKEAMPTPLYDYAHLLLGK